MHRYWRSRSNDRVDSEEGRPSTPAFEVTHLSQSDFQRLIHWHESYAQALGPKAMYDGQARAEQLKHQKWVRLVILAALRAGQNESADKDERTATDDLRSALDVEARGKCGRLIFGALGVILVGIIFSLAHRH
jgi:hypothetical protein